MNAPGDSMEGVGRRQTAGNRRNSHQSYQTRLQFWGAAIISSLFVTVLGATLFLGAVMVVGTMREGGGDGLTATGRTARIARPLAGGTLCHYVVFDNRTDQTIEDRIDRCDETKPKPKPEKPAIFSWGKK